MNWKKTKSEAKPDGGSVTTYVSEDGRYTIESRKRPIPHSGRAGYWMHTSYFLIDGSGRESEFWRLADAKDAAEMANKLGVRW
jgi:hypothetical protein